MARVHPAHVLARERFDDSLGVFKLDLFVRFQNEQAMIATL